VIIGESFGSLALLAGFVTRFAAGSLAVIMLGAVTMVHLPYGFFMNRFGQQQGEDYEMIGGGRWSIDREAAERVAR
jgi:putative oxidoreductase